MFGLACLSELAARSSLLRGNIGLDLLKQDRTYCAESGKTAAISAATDGGAFILGYGLNVLA